MAGDGGMLASLNASSEWKDLNPGGILSKSRGREQSVSSGRGTIVKGEIKGVGRIKVSEGSGGLIERLQS